MTDFPPCPCANVAALADKNMVSVAIICRKSHAQITELYAIYAPSTLQHWVQAEFEPVPPGWLQGEDAYY